MKNALILSLFILLTSCKSYVFNLALDAKGIYDDKIELNLITNNSKELIILPMHHIGTELFYDDVKSKIDSLKSEGYYFYYELIKSSTANDTILRKYRKFSGLPFSKNGYLGSIDSLVRTKFDLKLKKELINQPSYTSLGIDSTISKNVDARLEDMIAYYETNYELINLEDCDFETSVFEKSTCKKLKVDREVKNDVIVNFRNQIILKTIDDEMKNKIAIIYGEGHVKGLRQGLIDRGYATVAINKN